MRIQDSKIYRSRSSTISYLALQPAKDFRRAHSRTFHALKVMDPISKNCIKQSHIHANRSQGILSIMAEQFGLLTSAISATIAVISIFFWLGYEFQITISNELKIKAHLEATESLCKYYPRNKSLNQKKDRKKLCSKASK